MKKICFLLVLFLCPFSVFAIDLASNAKSAIIIEPTTGKIIFEKNSNERLEPASMTKIMTLLLTFEAIDNGRVSLDDMVNISKRAEDMGGSQMFLEAGSNIRLEEIIKGVSIASANDGAIALAEFIGGSVENFVDMMNKKVEDLGLSNTHFANPHGLHADNHYSSAYDMAIMASNLISHEKVLNYTSIYEDYFNKPDGSRTWLVNTNKLVRFLEGVDGLKTGYTSEAGYCLTATAKKGNVRYITVVMGEPSSDIRSSETANMLNYAFNSFKLNTILDKSQELGTIYIDKSKQKTAKIVVKNPVTELISKEKDIPNYTYNLKVEKITVPIKAGTKVGTVEILDNEGLIVREEDVTISYDIEKCNLWETFLENLMTIIKGKKINKI
ncbi:serine-type D-Ala-D-Ala carboxypeptidase [Mycoplasma sp. CAG:956]|nr:serine-type D-Ala-D-Ala carboxypeptidase [Mycoplasma sp. CAG:956]